MQKSPESKAIDLYLRHSRGLILYYTLNMLKVIFYLMFNTVLISFISPYIKREIVMETMAMVGMVTLKLDHIYSYHITNRWYKVQSNKVLGAVQVQI